MALTKNQIIDAIQNQLNIPKKQADDVLETMLELIKKTLESGEDVMISGFGKFCVKKKNKRKGRNPATGEDMMLDARKVLTFHCSGILKTKVNGK